MLLYSAGWWNVAVFCKPAESCCILQAGGRKVVLYRPVRKLCPNSLWIVVTLLTWRGLTTAEKY